MPDARRPEAPCERRCRRLTGGLLALLLPVTTGVSAAQWEFEPRVRVSETYTDNIGLASENEEWDLITEVTPGFSLSGEGARSRLNLDYHAQGLVHANDSDRNEVNHELGADSSVELVRERLFIDADATRREEFISDGELVPDSNIFGGRETVTTYGAGPRLQYGFGSFARLQTSLRRSVVDREESTSETTTDTASAELSNGPAFVDWGWVASYQRTDEDGAGISDERIFERTSGELNYRVGARTQLFVVGGVEDNEFDSTVEDEIDGNFWEAGFRWSPTRNSNLEAAAGERFFGETKRFSFDAQGPALSIDLGYQETLETRTTLEQERATFLVRDRSDPNRSFRRVVVSVPVLRDQVILEKRLSGGVAWERGYSRLSLDLIATERDFLETGEMTRTESIDLGYRWTRLARTVVNVGVGLTQEEFDQSAREDELRTVRAGATRDLGNDVSGSVDLQIDDRSSTVSTNEFDVTQITVSLEKRF